MAENIRELTVELGDRSYPILIGPGLLGEYDLSPYVTGSQVMIVTNETVAPLYLEQAIRCFPGKVVDSVVLPDGEKFKDWQMLQSCNMFRGWNMFQDWNTITIQDRKTPGLEY